MDAPRSNNLLRHYVVPSNVGVLFIFIAIVGLGLTLIATGVLALVEYRQERSAAAGRSPLTASTIVAATSNEKANPGPIAFYLDRRLAGGLLPDGTFSPPEEPPSAGPLAILFLNPTDTTLPTTVQFPAQTISVDTESGATSVCTPAISGDKVIWAAQDGSTYLDAALKLRLRSC
ncbi:MAG: hypothetical protein HY421_01860 [Candidatus Kerfeldbacteria bacterium]|nr:hypothetical protein [Candidatus Kerfeldbacteria bacterium]